MNSKDIDWIKICGICGVLSPMLSFTFISLSIVTFPEFSWTENALSDLGVKEGFTAVLFNYGLIIGGIFALVFALGLFKFLQEKLLGRIGAFLFILDALSLVAIGVFPENFGRIHHYVSVMFFAFFPMSILIICATFLNIGKVKIGLFTFAVALVVAIVWIMQFTVKFGSNVAIPETLSALSASAWSIILGIQMLKHTSRSKNETIYAFKSVKLNHVTSRCFEKPKMLLPVY